MMKDIEQAISEVEAVLPRGWVWSLRSDATGRYFANIKRLGNDRMGFPQYHLSPAEALRRSLASFKALHGEVSQ